MLYISFMYRRREAWKKVMNVNPLQYIVKTILHALYPASLYQPSSRETIFKQTVYVISIFYFWKFGTNILFLQILISQRGMKKNIAKYCKIIIPHYYRPVDVRAINCCFVDVFNKIIINCWLLSSITWSKYAKYLQEFLINLHLDSPNPCIIPSPVPLVL